MSGLQSKEKNHRPVEPVKYCASLLERESSLNEIYGAVSVGFKVKCMNVANASNSRIK